MKISQKVKFSRTYSKTSKIQIERKAKTDLTAWVSAQDYLSLGWCATYFVDFVMLNHFFTAKTIKGYIDKQSRYINTAECGFSCPALFTRINEP